jgi:signal peptidase II
LDQLSKLLVCRLWALGSLPIKIWPFLNIVYTKNRGISFGLLSTINSPYIPYILIGLAILIIGFLVTWYRRTTGALEGMGVLWIISGALGNLSDRFFWGSVVDFIDFHWGTWHFPAFNIADSLITLGTGLIIISYFAKKS